MTARNLRVVPAMHSADRRLGGGATPAGPGPDRPRGAGPADRPRGAGHGGRPGGAGQAALAELLVGMAPSAEDRRWTTDAICADGDPDRLFVTGAAQREAAKLCRNCPVQMECLADALDNRVEFGVWGGLTERQRRALLKRRPDVASWRLVLEQAREEARRSVAS